MEPFVDFGLFELLAASGLAWLARGIYTRRLVALGFLAVSCFAPAALVLFPNLTFARWIAALCLCTALVNAAILVRLTLDGRLKGVLTPTRRAVEHVTASDR